MACTKSTGGKFLLIAAIAGVVAVLVALWKASKPVPDPWSSESPQPDTIEPVSSREASVDEIRELARDEEAN
ncbi:hypothetical protein [Glutamicibacter sp. X7]